MHIKELDQLKQRALDKYGYNSFQFVELIMESDSDDTMSGIVRFYLGLIAFISICILLKSIL